MEHFAIIFKPDGKKVSIHSGARLIDAAGQVGIILNSVCGGKGTCGKCAVIIEPEGREVLACQHIVDSDLTVTIPTASRYFEHRILEHGTARHIDVSPTIYKKYAPEDSGKKVLGVAVDIGTTTVVAKLMDMAEGRTLATTGTLNPQSRLGDDVISRITYGQTADKLTELHETIIACINELNAELCQQASAEPTDIYEMCVVGNTTMNHIFLNLPIAQLGQAPYRPSSLAAHDMRPEQLALAINPQGNIHAVANIAGFVGADTTAVALATDIASAEDMTLVIDIGTNGELVLGTKDKLYAASCAAGPAFEGARITCGGRAAAGAIEAIVISGDDIDIDVIGDCKARSICGSGLIDAVAVLLDLGVIDQSGRFADADELREKAPAAILARLTEVDDQPAFILADGEPPVVLTQRDIRQTQLAKAAIRAGIKLLQKKLNLADADIERVYLAGAFGNYTSPENAARIGLLPDTPLERVRSIGNAAATGAQMALISDNCRKAAAELAEEIEYVEIAHEPQFQDVFTDCLFF